MSFTKKPPRGATHRSPATGVLVPTRPRAGVGAGPEDSAQPVQTPTGWMAQIVGDQLQVTATVTPIDARDIVKSVTLTANDAADNVLYCQANVAFADNDGAPGDAVSLAAITGAFMPEPGTQLRSNVVGYVTGPAGTRFFNFEMLFTF